MKLIGIDKIQTVLKQTRDVRAHEHRLTLLTLNVSLEAPDVSARPMVNENWRLRPTVDGGYIVDEVV